MQRMQVYPTKEEGEWQVLFSGPHFGKGPALQEQYHKGEERINITRRDRNVE